MATPEELAAAEAAKAEEAAKTAEAQAAKLAAEAKSKEDSTSPANEQDEPFDKDRAMATIHTLREIEKQAKKDKQELDRLKAEEEKRKEAEMTESERLKAQNEKLMAEKATLEIDLLRRTVIAETGIPDLFTERLKGTTKEEMLADAEEIKKTLPEIKTAPKIKATNPGGPKMGETDDEKRERLFGKPQNVFDLDYIQKMGGGVIHK